MHFHVVLFACTATLCIKAAGADEVTNTTGRPPFFHCSSDLSLKIHLFCPSAAVVYLLTTITAYGLWIYMKQLWYWKSRSIPGPFPLPFIGNAHSYFGRTFMDVESELIQKYGPLVGIMEGLSPVLIVADADMIDEIFIKNFSTFCDQKNYLFHPVMEQSIFTINGERWKRMRRILSLGLTGSKLRLMTDNIESCFASFTKFLDAKTDKVMGNIDIDSIMTSLMVDVTSKVLFAVDGNAYQTDSVFAKNATTVAKIPLRKLLICASMPEFLLRFFQFNVTPQGPTDFLIDACESVLKQRRQDQNRDIVNLISLLIKTQSADDGGLTDEEIQANIVLFLIGGFETTSASLSSACYCLAMHPEIQERLRSEVMDPMYSDGKKDSFMNAFIQEVLRMYPPVVHFDRYASSDVTIALNGKTLKFQKGDRVRLPIHHMQYCENLFQDAGVFNPDRFMPGGVSSGMRSYSFAVAARNCIGENFARFLIRLTLSHVVRTYHIHRSPQTADKLDVFSSLFLVRPKSNFLALKRLDNPAHSK